MVGRKKKNGTQINKGTATYD